MPKHRMICPLTDSTAPRLRLNAFASAVAAGIFVLPSASTWAATITVGGSCTLANSIIAANTDTTAGGACIPGDSGADTIVLPAGGTITLNAVLPDITSPITLQGNNATVTRDSGAAAFRIFTVTASGDLTQQRTTVSGGLATNPAGFGSYGGGIYSAGSLTLQDSTVTGNSAADNGGGIFIYTGNLSLSRSTVSDNRANRGGGIYTGFFSQTTTISDSSISNNTAIVEGGGLQTDSTTTTVSNSTVSGNTVTAPNSEGGGIYVDGGTMLLTESTVSGNSVNDEGGGIYVSGGSALTITRSTLFDNRAGDKGGGIYCRPGGTVVVSNSTISGNTAQNSGGGIFNDGMTSLVNSTLTGNLVEGGGSASGGGVHNEPTKTVTLANSIIAGNVAAFGAEFFNDESCAGLGTVINQGSNVLGHNGLTSAQAFVNFTFGTDDFNATSDGSNFLLSSLLSTTLQDNGGPTLTHALPLGPSPAADRAPSASCAGTTDQRGVNRNKDADGFPGGAFECDAGAYELGANSNDLAVEKTASAATVAVGEPVTFTITVTNNGPENSSGTSVIDQPDAGLSIVSATPSVGECPTVGGLGIACELGGLAVGASATVSLVATAPAAGSFTNEAQVVGGFMVDEDPDDTNNIDTVMVTVTAPPTVPVLVTPRFSATLSGRSTDTTPVPEGPAGVFSFTSQFCNTSAASVSGTFARTRELSPGKSLISRTRDAAAAPLGGVGSEQDFPLDMGNADGTLSNSECVNVLYRIGLDVRTPFSFRVDLLGNVVVP